MSFDYTAPAELFLAKRPKNGRKNYERFTTAAEAIRYAVEDLRTPKALGAWLQVRDERFNSSEIQRLYEAEVIEPCARVRSETEWGPLRRQISGFKRPPVSSKSRSKAPAWAITAVVSRSETIRRCVALIQ